MNLQKALLRAMFGAALAAVDPTDRIASALPDPPLGRTVVAGAGKAAPHMAAALEACWPRPLSGLVATPYGRRIPTRRIEIAEAGYPYPDAASVKAARRMLNVVRGLGPDDLVIALFSGGGSSTMALPPSGVTLSEQTATIAGLAAAGAPVEVLNAVRKHLSAVKGGRLAAAAAPTPVRGVFVSHIPGDDPAVIASGPTTPEASTPAEALELLLHWGVDPPPSVRALLSGAAGRPPAALPHVVNCVIATPHDALEAAAAVAREAGYAPLLLGEGLESDAGAAGRMHAGFARSVRERAKPLRPPCAILSGGESTPRRRAARNAEFALSFATALRGCAGIHAIACDTDGRDGGSTHAGAIVASDTLTRAAALGLDTQAAIVAGRPYDVFEALGDTVDTGPTGACVSDFRAVLID